MTKKTLVKSTYDKFVEKLNTEEQQEFKSEEKDLLRSEMILAVMAEDSVSICELAKFLVLKL